MKPRQLTPYFLTINVTMQLMKSDVHVKAVMALKKPQIVKESPLSSCLKPILESRLATSLPLV